MVYLVQETPGDGLRILMVLYNQAGRGTYWRAVNLARGLDEKGHTVHLLAISPKKRFQSVVRSDKRSTVTIVETPDLFRGPLRSGWDFWDVLMRIRWIRGHSFDLVHTFESRPVAIFPSVYAQRKYSIPLIMDWCDWFGKGGSVEQRPNVFIRSTLRPVETFFENHFRGYAAGTTVINNFLKNRAIKLGVDSSRISILPNGCNIDELWPISRTDAREQLGLANEDFTIGYIGGIFEQDAKLLARAFDKTVQVIPDIKLLIIGYCNIDFRSLVKNPESIVVTGPIPYRDINQYLGACDICMLPLKNSGANHGRFPLKLHDYMAVGRPVLATNVGEIGEFVREHKIGWLAKDNPLDIAERIVSISKLKEQRTLVGKHARHLAETSFAWNRMAGKLEVFYRKIIVGIESPLAEYLPTSARK